MQISSFVTPVAGIPLVKKEMAKFFGKNRVPPLVFVKWKSTLPVEIELIATAPIPKVRPKQNVEFITPPGMQPSPIFSRVTRINYGKVIYISGLYGEKYDVKRPPAASKAMVPGVGYKGKSISLDMIAVPAS